MHEISCRFVRCPHKIYRDFYTELLRNCLQNLPEIACSYIWLFKSPASDDFKYESLIAQMVEQLGVLFGGNLCEFEPQMGVILV